MWARNSPEEKKHEALPAIWGENNLILQERKKTQRVMSQPLPTWKPPPVSKGSDPSCAQRNNQQDVLTSRLCSESVGLKKWKGKCNICNIPSEFFESILELSESAAAARFRSKETYIPKGQENRIHSLYFSAKLWLFISSVHLTLEHKLDQQAVISVNSKRTVCSSLLW